MRIIRELLGICLRFDDTRSTASRDCAIADIFEFRKFIDHDSRARIWGGASAGFSISLYLQESVTFMMSWISVAEISRRQEIATWRS